MNELNFYIDDSGTRNPDRQPGPSAFGGDWFALGGILLRTEDEQQARDLHAEFCKRWEIDYPLHSVKIRHRSDKFAWIGALSPDEQARFFAELDQLVVSLPVWALACVIDRPGYNTRYSAKYGQSKWSLCKTAFSILAERVAKAAALKDSRVRLYVERSDKHADRMIRDHYDGLRQDGMPFAAGGDPKYGPLTNAEMRSRLYDLKFKTKTSPMMQLADLLLYPLCKSAYQPGYRPMALLKEHGRLIEATLPAEMAAICGSKYSCFDQVATAAE